MTNIGHLNYSIQGLEHSIFDIGEEDFKTILQYCEDCKIFKNKNVLGSIDGFGQHFGISSQYILGCYKFLKIHQSPLVRNRDSIISFFLFVKAIHGLTKGKFFHKHNAFNYIHDRCDLQTLLIQSYNNAKWYINTFEDTLFTDKYDYYIDQNYIVRIEGGCGAGTFSFNIKLGYCDNQGLWGGELYRVGCDTQDVRGKKALRIIRCSSGYKKAFPVTNKNYLYKKLYAFKDIGDSDKPKILYMLDDVTLDSAGNIPSTTLNYILGQMYQGQQLSKIMEYIYEPSIDELKNRLYHKYQSKYDIEPKYALYGILLFIADAMGFDTMMALSTQGAKKLNLLKNTLGTGVDYTSIAQKFGFKASASDNRYIIENFQDCFPDLLPSTLISRKELQGINRMGDFIKKTQNKNTSNISDKLFFSSESNHKMDKYIANILFILRGY